MAQTSMGTGYRGVLGDAGLFLPRRTAGHGRKILPLGFLALALLVLAMLSSSSAPSGALSAREEGAAPATTPEEATALPSEPAAASPDEQEVLDAYAELPLSFVPNAGQTDDEVRYYAQGPGYGFSFTREGAMLSFAEGERGAALALDFLEANPDVALEPRQQLPGTVNHLVGDDPAGWQTGLPTHGELVYGGLWPGIDMVVRGEGGKLKYEFHVMPGASVEDVRLAYRGAEGLSVGAGGELLVQTPLGVLEDAAPVSYQEVDGERVPVESRYALLEGDDGYGFAVGSGYDPRYPLVIDPELAYSTFLGGEGRDVGEDVALDQDGNAYVTGSTAFSAGYPTTPGAFDTTLDGVSDAFVTKLNADGSALLYSTFLGGTGSEQGNEIAVDQDGNAYVTGETNTADYPTTPGAFDTTYNGSGDFDAFVTKLDADGSALGYSTFLGGTRGDFGQGIAVDLFGRAYVTGETSSAEYPTTPGAFDTTFNDDEDAFVTRLNASGSALGYSTFLGGTGDESGLGIAVDLFGRAYVTGGTSSAEYPTTPFAFDATINGSFDAFVTKLNASGSALLYSTFLGGTGFERGSGIAVDPFGRVYVTGETSSAEYPTTPGAFDTTLNGSLDAFVTKLNAFGSALGYSTFLGGTDDDRGFGIEVDGSGNAYVTGQTNSADYPTTDDAFDTTHNGSLDAFVTKLNTFGSALLYSTFLGGTSDDVGFGIEVDGSGNAYVAGFTRSAEYPTTPGAFDATYNESGDAFVTKLPTG